MAKVKSIKFYNFVELSGSQGILINIRFYNINGKLILIDFSNPISSTNTYNENSGYIITSYSSYDINHYPCCAFHIGNKNIDLNISHIGYAWTPTAWHGTSNDFLKIEFKFPQYLSKIEVLHSYCNNVAIDTMNYDIEFNDGTIKTYHFKSNGVFSTITASTMDNFLWNQDTLDSLFSELEFDNSKQTYDTAIGYIETLDTNNFRNIPINTIKRLKSLCINPPNTYVNCLISFDKKQTWKTFNNSNWLEILDISPENIILNGMNVGTLNQLDKNKLISGGFTGDLDFKIAMKTNDTSKTPSIIKIYIEYE